MLLHNPRHMVIVPTKKIPQFIAEISGDGEPGSQDQPERKQDGDQDVELLVQGARGRRRPAGLSGARGASGSGSGWSTITRNISLMAITKCKQGDRSEEEQPDGAAPVFLTQMPQGDDHWHEWQGEKQKLAERRGWIDKAIGHVA